MVQIIPSPCLVKMMSDDEGILVAAMMIYFFHLVSGLIHCAMMPDVCVFSCRHAVMPSCHDSKDT